jgi:hypothetical protein
LSNMERWYSLPPCQKNRRWREGVRGSDISVPPFGTAAAEVLSVALFQECAIAKSGSRLSGRMPTSIMSRIR